MHFYLKKGFLLLSQTLYVANYLYVVKDLDVVCTYDGKCCYLHPKLFAQSTALLCFGSLISLNATSSLVHLENKKKIFFFGKRSSLLQNSASFTLNRSPKQLLCFASAAGSNPTIISFNATSILARLENKNIFFYFEKRSSPPQKCC
jgi:hypothetical protein